MSGKKVFIVGPGFIGWVVLDLLVKEGYDVTAMCRRKEHGAGIEQTGGKVIYGDLADHDLIAKHTAESDITIHTATADDLPSVKAVLDGVKQRSAAGKEVIYIHTSGTSVLNDGSEGEYLNEKVYKDTDRAAIDSVPDDAPHREIDLTIVNVQKELGDKAKIAIMIPPEIYGYNAWNGRLTIQIPTLTRFALKHGFSGCVGKGLSIESQIHVNDLARAYIVLLHYIEKNTPTPLLENPYFFCENGKEFSWKEVAEEIAKGLHNAGKLKSTETKTIPPEMYGELFVSDEETCDEIERKQL